MRPDCFHWCSAGLRSLLARFRSTEGSELIELAVSLPLLAVFAVGIYDFGSAFIVKHKLNSAVMEGIRIASSRPGISLSGTGTCGGPVAVCLVRDIVTSNLTAGRINTCGLGSATAAPSGSLTWTFTVNCGPSQQLVLKIERGFFYDATMDGSFSDDSYRMEATRVTLTYPFPWQFGRVFGLLGSSIPPSGSPITIVGIMQNID